MNLTYFCPKLRGNVEKKNNPDLSPKRQTWGIYLRTSHLMSR